MIINCSTIISRLRNIRGQKRNYNLIPYTINYGPCITDLALRVFQKKTYYLDSQVKGQSSLPTILIFHDAGLSSNTWLKLGLLHELNVNGYRAVVIDLPGHGGSDKTEIIQDQDEKG